MSIEKTVRTGSGLHKVYGSEDQKAQEKEAEKEQAEGCSRGKTRSVVSQSQVRKTLPGSTVICSLYFARTRTESGI